MRAFARRSLGVCSEARACMDKAQKGCMHSKVERRFGGRKIGASVIRFHDMYG